MTQETINNEKDLAAALAELSADDLRELVKGIYEVLFESRDGLSFDARRGQNSDPWTEWDADRVVDGFDAFGMRPHDGGRPQVTEVTLTEAAELRGVHRSRVYALYRAGRLKGRKVGAMLLFKRADVETLEVRPGPGRPRKA